MTTPIPHQRAETTVATKPPRRKRGRPAIDLAPYDPAEVLTTPGREVAYLRAVFDEDDGDGRLIALALGAVARKHGMVAVAETAGLNPTTLYRSLSPKASPSLATVLRVLRALGYRLIPVRHGGAEAAE